MAEIRDLLKATESKLYSAIGDHLFDLQVQVADLEDFDNGLNDLFEPDDYATLGLTDDLRREFILKRCTEIIKHGGPIGNCVEIRQAFESTQSHTYIEIGNHLYELQVNKNDVTSINDLSSFFNELELNNLGLKSPVKKKLAFKKALNIFTQVAQEPAFAQKQVSSISNADTNNTNNKNIDNGSDKDENKDGSNVANEVGANDTFPNPSSSPKLQSNLLNLNDTVDTNTFWTFYFKQQASVTYDGMKNAIEKTMEQKYLSSNDSNDSNDETNIMKTKDKFIQCIMIDIMNNCQNGYNVEKQEFETFVSKISASINSSSTRNIGVIEVFDTLQSEFEELANIDKSNNFGAIEPTNSEEYLLKIMKYAKLLSANLSSRLWSHIIISNYNLDLNWVMKLCDKFRDEYSVDTGFKILQSDIFSNRNRLVPLLSSVKSSFFRIGIEQMINLLQLDTISCNEEYLFDAVVTWCEVYHKRMINDSNVKKVVTYPDPKKIKSSEDLEDVMEEGTYPFGKHEDLIEIMIQFIRFPVMKTEYLLRKVLPFRELFGNDTFMYLLAFKLSKELPESEQKSLDFGRYLPFRKVKRKHAPELQYDGSSAREIQLKEEKRKLEALVTNLQRNNSHLQKEVKKHRRRSKTSALYDVANEHKNTSSLQDGLSLGRIGSNGKPELPPGSRGSRGSRGSSTSNDNNDDEKKPDHRRNISITSEQADDIQVGDVTSSFTITFARLLNQDDGGDTYDALKRRMEKRRGAGQGGSRKQERDKKRKDKVQKEKQRREKAKMAQSSALYEIRSTRNIHDTMALNDDVGYSMSAPDDEEDDDDDYRDAQNGDVGDVGDVGDGQDDEKEIAKTKQRGQKGIKASNTDGTGVNGTDDVTPYDEDASDIDSPTNSSVQSPQSPKSTQSSKSRQSIQGKARVSKSVQVGKNVNKKGKKKKKKKKRAQDLELPLYKNELTLAERKRHKQEKALIRRMDLQIGDKIQLKRGDRKGVVKYIGQAHWVYGYVIGIELFDNSNGKHSGQVDDIYYFDTQRASKGLFVKIESINKIIEKRKKKKKKSENKPGVNINPWYSDEDGDDDDDGNGSEYELDLSDVPKKERERLIRMNIQKGDVVTLDHGRRGVVQYCGAVDWTDDVLFGIELLDKAAGKHNGVVDGTEYFQCEDNRGIFVPLNKVRKKATLNQNMTEW